jgi:hypothetical protein
MANIRKAGVSEPIGPGERLERSQRARRALILYLLMVAGAVTGLGLSIGPEQGAGILTGSIAPGMAMLLAALWLISVIGGSIWYARQSTRSSARLRSGA